MDIRACLIAGCLVLTACSGSRRALPLPPIRKAPPEVADLRILVMNASHETARIAGEDTVTGYTIMMREAVQRSLQRAGYRVVVRAADPYDLIARVDVAAPSLERPGTAAMILFTPDGVVVEQVSGIVELDEHVDIDERGPVAMVEKLGHSGRISGFARNHRRDGCERVPVAPKKDKVLEVPQGSLESENGTEP